MLTLQEIISASPFHHAEIIGGWEGKERHFTTIQNNSIRLEEPSLVLLPKSVSTVIQLNEYLSVPYVQGILIYGNEDLFIPTTTIDAADTYKKPVLLINETNPDSIIQKFADLQHLKTSGLYHYVWERSTSYWLQLMNDRGLAWVLHRLRLFLGQEILLVNKELQIFSIDEGNWTSVHEPFLNSIANQHVTNNQGTFSLIKRGADDYLLFQLHSGEKHFGYILFQELPGMMIDISIEQITHALPAIVTYLMKEEAVMEAHRSYKQHFLYNLLYNNLESEQGLISQGNQWGWDFTIPTQLMVMRLNAKSDIPKLTIDLEAIIRKIRSLVSSAFLQAIIFPIQGNIVIIVFDNRDNTPKKRKEFMISLANKIQKEIEYAQPNMECHIGLGRHYPSNMELFRSFYEAKVALELGKFETKKNSVRHFEDIGIARLLSNIHNDLLHEYYQETLGELILLDETNDDFYLETLEVFFYNNGDINQTAEHLYIHPNTLRKRLKRLESILNIDFNQLDDMLKIFVAIKIMKMLK
ncbi:helix-turn-helix domain-containing protein [Neobacillus novalis]|uniref:Helix-turn-helix domain-containing protein n=1 Tax=Neobacillus novalis TaxID=220687 RepID=A0AA95SDI9_9BACI|nr:helix-turn-helix domain-containing protein [Neobacillus novalis]WHY88889.1 helix-turn-helix domain-containing protein [Neobacillus novalis]